jgi:hypothetical protein
LGQFTLNEWLQSKKQIQKFSSAEAVMKRFHIPCRNKNENMTHLALCDARNLGQSFVLINMVMEWLKGTPHFLDMFSTWGGWASRCVFRNASSKHFGNMSKVNLNNNVKA